MSFEPRLYESDDLDSESLPAGHDIGEQAALDSTGDDYNAGNNNADDHNADDNNAEGNNADDNYELPDHLLDLAAQLTFDANHLAQRYPAQAIAVAATTGGLPASAEAASADVRRYRPQFPWRAAMAFLISGVAIWTASQAMRQRAAAPVRPLATTTVSNVGSPAKPVADAENAVAVATLAVAKVEGDRRPAPHELTAPENSAAGESLTVFERLSGAEQEAVLDLMEHGPAGQDVWGI